MDCINGGGGGAGASRASGFPDFLARVLFLLFFFQFGLGALDYTVLPEDTLYNISRKYGVPVSWIMRQNGLESNVIRSGQRIDIPVGGVRPLKVRPGDTLSSLAAELEVSATELRVLNNLSSDSLYVGQELRIPGTDAHRVSAGETLSGIAERYGKPIAELRALNRISDDVIYTGQLVYLNRRRPASHRVTKGDSLWSIASSYDVSVSDILAWNSMDSNTIRVGEEVRLYPTVEEKASGLGGGNEIRVALASISPLRPQSAVSASRVSGGAAGGADGGTLPRISARPENNILPRQGEYFFSAPRKQSQPSLVYWEGTGTSVSEDFRRATRILAEYDNSIDKMSRVGRELEGWHIVLDPGHGGLDPGAMVEVQDGNGNRLMVTEDEYVYDITVRLYRILKRYGASVSITMLAPDHHSRDGHTARRTFVNRKNEVYNDKAHNSREGWRPIGTARGLDMRKDITGKQIRNISPELKSRGTLFLSIHADNSPNLPSGLAVFYDGIDKQELTASRNMAMGLAEHMGGKVFVRQQNLRVLKNNPAQAAVLVEVRNVHYKSGAWALRSFRMREEDAQRIAGSLAAWLRER